MAETEKTGKILVIAEKPSVARDYARVLGASEKGEGYLFNDRYIVSWAVGHLIQLCEPDSYDEKYKRWVYQDLPIIPQEMKLQVIRGNGKQFQILKKLMNSKEVDSIICGTDSGREGELIFRYIYQVAGCKKPFDRLWVSSMTDEAIRKGFADLRSGKEYDSLFESAKCRSEADWLVGMNGTRAFTIKYDELLSIGRVQTPTLSIIVRRQKEIDDFVPEKYYEVKLDHTAGQCSEKDTAFTSGWFKANGKQKESRIREEAEAKRIADGASAIGKAMVEEIVKVPGKQLPPLLYDLTELQRDANRRYGYSANKTLQLAQSLYEKHKLLTYPRTDSRYLPDDMKDTVRRTLHAINIPEFHNWLMGIKDLWFNGRIIDNSKITDHHAIIPTPRKPDLSKLAADEKNIYVMVCQRLIEVFYPAYEYETTEVTLLVKNGQADASSQPVEEFAEPYEPYEERFLAKGKVVTQLGFMALRKSAETARSTDVSTTETAEEKPKSKRGAKSSKASKEEDTELPEMTEGQIIPIKKADVAEKKTQQPKPFTEATLLTAMEYAGKYIEDEDLKEEMDKLSLGTPATRASIIERLINVKYIYRSGKALIPTEKGKQLIAIVPPELKSPEMTGKWERSLDKIYQGGMDPARFRGSIERYVRYIIGEAGKQTDVVFEKSVKKKRASKSPASQNGDNDQVGKTDSLGTCPLCGQGSIKINRKAFYCTDWKKGCKFTVWLDALDRYGAHLDEDMMKKILMKQSVQLPLTKPQTGEKGSAEIYLTSDGKLEIKNWKMEK